MPRNAALAAIKAAGTQNDHKAFVRLYVENRVSLAAARKAFNEGQRFATFITKRDAATAEGRANG
jgi:hypothetical protein